MNRFFFSVLTNRVSKAYKTYGPLLRVWFGFLPVFVAFRPEDLQIILGSKKHTEKSRFYKLLHNFLGDGLITSSGEKWSSHRKYLQPTFHLSILEKFIATFVDSAQCLREKLKDCDEVNITSFINGSVLDILNGEVSKMIFTLIIKDHKYFHSQRPFWVFRSKATSHKWKIHLLESKWRNDFL